MESRPHATSHILEKFMMLEAVLDSAYNGIIAIDAEGQVIFLNRAAEELLGKKKKEVLGKFITDVVPTSELFTVVHSGKPQRATKVKVGDKMLYSNRAPIYLGGKVVGAVGVFQDVTEIVELTRKLEEREMAVETLETILDNIIDGIVLVDKHGIITKINRAYQEFLGIKEEDAVGRHVTEVIENTRMHIVIETGEAEIGHVQKIQGKEMIVMRIPVFKNGEIIGAVGKVMFRDVRELKDLALKLNVMEGELSYYKKELQRIQGARYSFSNIIGKSKPMLKAKQLAKQAAISNSTVLICGESGTGKELFAQAIHNYSLRRYGPFVRVNCAAIPHNLFESELFGYEKGAFTGASKEGKLGKFEIANGGTIFLDEIGELPLEMQVKLLRVLQEKEVERIGGNRLIPLDVRVIAATNKPLEELVKEGRFRKDLYYRLNVLRVDLPPLREIKEDIPVLVNNIIQQLNEELGTKVCGVQEEVLALFNRYSWPGNIRELHNVLERCVNLCRSGTINKRHLPLYFLENKEDCLLKNILPDEEDLPGNLSKLMDMVEKAALKRVLALTGNNKRKSAQILGIHRSALYQKLKKHNLV